MRLEDFVDELEKELEERHHYCENYAASPCDILLAVLNAVAGAKFTASQQAHPADPEKPAGG